MVFALKIARIALALTVLLYASAYALLFTKLADPLTCLLIAGYSGIGLGISAAACVGIQGYFWVRPRHN
jgi:hypothetical protein